MKKKQQIEFVPDSRFQAMGKEAIIVLVYWLAMFIGVMLSAIFLGRGNPADYTYLFGFPPLVYGMYRHHDCPAFSWASTWS